MTEIEQITAETGELSAQELAAFAFVKFGSSVALASSFSVEDQVLTHMLWETARQKHWQEQGLTPSIFTLDTGRLPQETYDVIEATRKRYGLQIEVLFPDYRQVEPMVASGGVNLFYSSVESRRLCCQVRKVLPLQRKLSQLRAWMTGLRREQAATRGQLQRVEFDAANNLVKFNPLADWTSQQVWDFIRSNNVPYNALHDRGYPSIGCAPCTRAVEPGQDIRAGRWWWEQPEHKECGLHLKDGKLVRASQ